MRGDAGTSPAALTTTQDAFLGGELSIAQPVGGSRAGVDAVFLAAACPARAGETVLDAGTGSGVVALSIARRVHGAIVTGIEIDEGLCELARGNALRNSLQDRARFIQGDLTAPLSRLFGEGLAPDSFDHAVANPPFLAAGEARLPPHPLLRRAHALEPGELEAWIKCLACFVRPGGSITVVHRADALAPLLGHLQGRFGGLIVYPLFPRQGAPASRILIQGRKGSRAPLSLRQGMILHGSGNGFTPEAEPILRSPTALELGCRD